MPDFKRLVKRKNSAKKMNRGISKPKSVLRPITFLLIVGTLFIGILFSIRFFLLDSSDFKISRVSIVDADGKRLENPERVFRLNDDLNLFSFDIKMAAQDIQARHPEFLSVRICKQLPNTLMIMVEQRRPLAILGVQRTYLTDEEGFILPYESKYKDLPKIVGIHPRQIRSYEQSSSLRLKRALALIKELKKAKIYPQFKVTQIDVRQYANIIFYLENRTEVKMGEADYGRKAALLSGILTQLKEDNTVPKYIDMRFDSPAVMP